MNGGSQQRRRTARVPTGIAGLDQILHGGLLRGGIYIVSGQPGAGKTILANQVCFNHVAAGGRALFVTLLAETHERMLEHLAGLEFFDPEPIGDRLYYISGFETMEQQGLAGLINLLRREIQVHRATLLVIDGMATVWSVADSDVTFRRFIHDVQVFLTASGCTALFLTQRDDQHFRAEHTMVDGLIELLDVHADVRAMRELEITKFRGSAFLRGRHFFEITNAGIVVYPRTEALLADTQPSAQAPRRRLPFNIGGLDDMLQGGLLSTSVSVLLGVPGSGKTLLSLHFLAAGAQAGEVGLYFGFYETPARVIEKADQVGLRFSEHVARGLLHLAWHPPLEQPLDQLAASLLEAVARYRAQRVVIDGLNSLQQGSIYPERLGRFLTAITNELRARSVTTIFTVETPHLLGTPIEWPVRDITLIAENIIFLRYVEANAHLLRLLSILKVRDSDYDTTTRTFTIGSDGIRVGEPYNPLRLVASGSTSQITSPGMLPLDRLPGADESQA
ncbi:ATPase domain-containing protein [Kallotenue papyrolyticum]|uniref:ATPase domain-containing protein n=1 Tax=Kallotenue papyrolyticum TaxID=1325125 RepID=UPI000492346B|nr:ATPase domain-containing protein [Kallotenue papyrolyticum]